MTFFICFIIKPDEEKHHLITEDAVRIAIELGLTSYLMGKKKLSFKEGEIYKLKKTEIDGIISEMLFRARIQTIKDILDDLSRKTGENLLCITSGRYNKIRLGKNLDNN